MIELRGKYNNAKVFTDTFDSETGSQLINLLSQEFVKGSQIRIMPDTHAGAGCVIGTTMTIKDKVCPNLVGGDIGCSVSACRLKEKDIDLEKLDNVIRTYVPSGFNIHERAIAKSNADKILAPVDVDKAFKSLGTLGGGNHFLEVDRDKNGYLWLVIHTGSRHLGLEVANYYQNLAYKKLQNGNVKDEIRQLVAKYKSEGRTREIESAIKDLYKNKPKIIKDLAYVEGNDFNNYIHDMKLTQEHAKINHRIIAETIVNNMDFHIKEVIHTTHNYIDTDNMILRKGAVAANFLEPLIIPMNMRDGSLICVGKSNPDWNYSAPHGAGRIMSRGQAKENVKMEDFKESMEGIFSTCVKESTLDESPMAYKPMDEIIRNIKDTVEIVDVIKPIYNFKAN